MSAERQVFYVQGALKLIERVWPDTVQLFDLRPAEFRQPFETLNASSSERSLSRLGQSRRQITLLWAILCCVHLFSSMPSKIG